MRARVARSCRRAGVRPKDQQLNNYNTFISIHVRLLNLLPGGAWTMLSYRGSDIWSCGMHALPGPWSMAPLPHPHLPA